MMAFRVRNIVPPGGRYFFTVEQTGVRLEAFSMSGLLGQLRAHLLDNKLPLLPDPQAAVEDFMCRQLPEGFCFGDLDGRPRTRVLTLQQIKEATNTLAAGNPRVLPGEARRRAEICSGCPRNDRSVCPTCIGLVAWSRRLAGQSIGGRDEWLGVCTVDGTALPAKIHMSRISANPEYPTQCWRSNSHDAKA